MRPPMLNAIQKVKLAMGKKLPKLSMEYPKLNKGFEALPVKAQENIMKNKQPKLGGRRKR
tara:strand:- start:345 stop:524 length:180 start_codon:yes stop_codon:yes gene_type:complete